MARIFTTKFNFNHKVYDAIITLISNDGNTSFHVRLLDTELYDVIPDGQLNYHGKDGFKEINKVDNQLAKALMNSVAASIEHHMVLTS
jgi:hypothetical protein